MRKQTRPKKRKQKYFSFSFYYIVLFLNLICTAKVSCLFPSAFFQHIFPCSQIGNTVLHLICLAFCKKFKFKKIKIRNLQLFKVFYFTLLHLLEKQTALHLPVFSIFFLFFTIFLKH